MDIAKPQLLGDGDQFIVAITMNQWSKIHSAADVTIAGAGRFFVKISAVVSTFWIYFRRRLAVAAGAVRALANQPCLHSMTLEPIASAQA
jgi:hypothetical protein